METRGRKPLIREIKVFHKNDMFFLPISEINRFEGRINYSIIVTNSGREYLSSYTLKYFQLNLSRSSFYRVHKSHLVNKNRIRKICLIEGKHKIEFSNGEKIDISRRMLKLVLELVKK